MISYTIGDATAPEPAVAKNAQQFILHLVNNRGVWGAGFVMALTRRWPAAEQAYRAWASGELTGAAGMVDGCVTVQGPFELGGVQYVEVEPGLWVTNVCALDFESNAVGIPLRYDALRHGLNTVGGALAGMPCPTEVHMPRIGTGIAGGAWTTIEGIIHAELAQRVPVTVYDLAS